VVTAVSARLLVLRALVRSWLVGEHRLERLGRRRRHAAELGVETITWIVLTAIMVAVAIAAAAIVKSKVLGTANNIQTQ